MSGWGTSWDKPKNSQAWEDKVNKAYDEKWPSDNKVMNAFNEHVEALEKKWPKAEAKTAEEILKHDTGITAEMLGVNPALSRGNYLNKADWEAGVKEYNNKVPTHDPYTNPNSHIYYECKCGAILDPNTKSFAALNNYASEKGWKVRWRQDGAGYEPFCVECGKDVE